MLDTAALRQRASELVRSRYAVCRGHEVHFMDWGRPDAPPLFMWHGLARCGRDFDPIASALSHKWRVICPDQIGRGLSQWSGAPEQDYCLESYAAIAAALADSLGLEQFDWVGTSMGGALGMVAAATNLRGRLRRLVVNDIGPSLPRPAVDRIRAYAGSPPAFERFTDFEGWIRLVYEPFGTHSDAQWRHLAETTCRRLPDGRVSAHYDPRIVAQFEAHPEDYERWGLYDTLALPLLVLRGASSDLLLPDVASEMGRRGPRAQVVEIPGCGHAPGLNTPEQIGIVEAFLDARP